MARVEKISAGFIFSSIVIIIMASMPVFYVVHLAGSNWHGIIPQYVTDLNFYLPKLAKGTDIFPFGNNPFLLEHVKDVNATPSIADYIGAIPLKLGLSLMATLIFNAVFWNLVFAYLCYLLLKNLGIKKSWAAIFVLPLYFSVYGMLIKPVVLQIVMPFFLLFIIALIGWIKNPSRNSSIILSLSLAGTLYTYPYSFQIASAIAGSIFIFYLWKRKWGRVSSLVYIGIGSSLICLPGLIYIYKEISHPLFLDMITRSGSIETRIPSQVSIYTGRWIFTGITMLYSLFYLLPDLKKDKEYRFLFDFLTLIGVGMGLVLLSPIITGRDAMIGNHVGREIFWWLSLSVICAIYFFVERMPRLYSQKKLLVIFLIILNIIPLLRQYKRSLLQPFQSSEKEILEVQDYAKPLNWLDNYDINPAVIWANPEISTYIPYISRHYVLTPGAFLVHQYFVDISEVKERYLTARYFVKVDRDLLANEYEMPIGSNFTQRKAHLEFMMNSCEKFIFFECNKDEYNNLLSSHEKDIKDLVTLNDREIRPNINKLLAKYNVSYAIKDAKNDRGFYFDKLKNTKEIYNDGRFIIYKFKR